MLAGLSPKVALVVAPHADDEILGAGGFIARASQAGWEVGVLFATVSGYRSAVSGESSTGDERLQEVQAALKMAGAAWFEIFRRHEDHHLRLDQVPQTELIAFIESFLSRCRPSVVIVPCRGHYHQDHRALADACVTALRPAPTGRLPFVPVVLAYGHAAAGWGGQAFGFQPNFFVDISGVVETKLQALACYRSQVFPPPHARSLDAVRHQAASWGAYAGVSHAEPYECLRYVWS